MRDIKFRAYSHKSKQMFDWGSLLQDDLAAILTSGEDEVMEYTGLKDKNGKEIYEGDILKATDEIGVIKFGEYDHKYHDGMLGFYLDCGELGIFDAPTASCGEVIGNIYENPELLKVQENQ